jgi:alpha-beta hydrolase superfamily lysophospholipase
MIPDIAGVVTLGALLRVGPNMLPPKFVLRVLQWLRPYYPKMKMPATDFSASFDDAFGDKRWAAVARSDPRVQVSPQATLSGAVLTVSTGEDILARANEWNLPLLAIHSKYDCRADFDAIHQFVDKAGRRCKAEGYWLDDTTGHQLLLDVPAVTNRVMDKVADWVRAQVDKTFS